MRDEEWSELAARRMARHVTTFRRRGGRLYAVQSLRFEGDGAGRRRVAWVMIVSAVVGAALMWVLGGGR